MKTPILLPGKPLHSPRGYGPWAVKPAGKSPSPAARSLANGLSSWFVSDTTDQTGNYSGQLYTAGSPVQDYLFTDGNTYFYVPSESTALTGNNPEPMVGQPFALSFAMLPDPLGAGWEGLDTETGQFGAFGYPPLADVFVGINGVYDYLIVTTEGYESPLLNYYPNPSNSLAPVIYVFQSDSSGNVYLYGSDGASLESAGSILTFSAQFDWGDGSSASLDYLIRNCMVWADRILTTAEINYLLAGGIPSL